MACPTREEYEGALKRRAYANDILKSECEIREELFNKLCSSHECIKCYKDVVKNANEIIQKYEIYQELLENYK